MKSTYPIATPIGTVVAEEEDGAVVRLHLPCAAAPAPEGSPQTNLRTELAEYFAGKRKAFTVPLAYTAAAFRLAALRAALAIPYGATATYAQLANAAGNPKAARAAGHAMAMNPLPILIPCHRVVHSAGHKLKYAGGAEMKAFLLELERKNV